MDIISPCIQVTAIIRYCPMHSLIKRLRKHIALLMVLVMFILAGCQQAANSPASRITPEPAVTMNPTSTVTTTLTAAGTDTLTPSPSVTWTETPPPSMTPSPSVTPTATSVYPQIRVLEQANCRYGPGVAYLYAHGLYADDRGEVHGRNYSGTWLWIKPWNLDWHCWVAASVTEVSGDIKALNVVQTRLPKSTLYGPPDEIQAVREGDIVRIAWSPVWMTEDDDRGYLIEATVCQNGSLIPVAIHIDGTSAEILDEIGCSGESKGLLYTVEKHGYTDPIVIPWP